MKFEAVLPDIGGMGRYQYLVIAASLIFFFANVWQFDLTIFIAGNMDHWCHIPQLKHLNTSTYKHLAIPTEMDKYGKLVYSQCKMFDLNYSHIFLQNDSHSSSASYQRQENATTRKCTSYVYDRSVFYSTLISQYDLVCEREWLYTLSATAFMTGLVCGAFCSGHMADHFGRKKIATISLFLNFASTMAAAFVPNYFAFLALRMFAGATALGSYQPYWTLVLEALPTEKRSKGFFIYMVGRRIKIFFLPIPFFVRNHITLQWITSLLLVPGIVAFVLTPESPRWLLAKGRITEGEKVCKLIARINGVKLSSDFNMENYKEEIDDEHQTPYKKNATLFDLFKTPRLRKHTVISYLMWFALVFTSYGLGLNIGQIIPGSIYTNLLIIHGVDILCIITAYIALFKMGRRTSVGLWLIINGVCILAMTPLLLLDIPILVTVFASCGNLLQSNLWGLVYIYAGEIFPTVARTIGLGSGSSFGNIGGLITPQIPLLGDIWYGLPYLLLGGVPVIVGGLIFLLPETKGQRLPDTLEEAEYFGTAHFDSAYPEHSKVAINNGHRRTKEETQFIQDN